MRLTFVTLALASWLGTAGLTDPLWTILGRALAAGEKTGATWDPDGLTVAPPEGARVDPNGLDSSADEGAGWDRNG
jgi:hypothetical protein